MPTTAIKEQVRAYADREFGDQWDCASVMVCLRGRQPEVLVVVNKPAAGKSDGPPGQCDE